MVSEAIKPLQLVDQVAEFKFESKFAWVPAAGGHLAISPKAVREGNWRFRGQNQRPSSLGRSENLILISRSLAKWNGLFCCADFFLYCCSISHWTIGLWVKIWHRNKTACSELNHVQSSRSKSTTYPRKASAQNRIEQHSDFRWRRAKDWKRY